LLVAAGLLRMDAPHPALLWLLAWLCMASVAEGTIVLFAVLGSSLGQLLALLLFVYAGLATAGGTVPLQALPGILGWLAQIEPLRQILDGTRAILYFNAQADAGLARAVTYASLGLVFWLILGAVVVRWYDRKGYNRLDPELLGYVAASVRQYKSRNTGTRPQDPPNAGRQTEPDADADARQQDSGNAASSTLLGRFGCLPGLFVVSCRDDPAGDRGGPATAAGFCRGDARRAAALGSAGSW